ncbi:MAG: hypothetical protein C4324_04940 [Blastocatellia bacterium]
MGATASRISRTCSDYLYGFTRKPGVHPNRFWQFACTPRGGQWVSSAADDNLYGFGRFARWADGGAGVGLPGIVITVTDADTGLGRATRTNSFGNYRVEGLTAGRTYIITASNSKFIFDPQSRVVILTEDIADLDFRASN